MSPFVVGAGVAALLGLGVWCLVIACRRAPRSLAAARRQMYGPRRMVGGDVGPSVTRFGTVAESAVGRAIVRHVGGDVTIIGLTPASLVSRVVTATGLMSLALLAAVVAGATAGLVPASLWWVPVCAAIGVLVGWVSLREVAASIQRRRRDFRQAANDFVQLVAVGLTTDQSVEEAIRFALAVGEGTAFDTLRQQVLAAPQRGVPVWEAIDEFGARFDIRELREFATSVERQGVQGVSIGESVATLATSMRASALDRLEREADRANANLAGPTVGFVVATIVFLAYPLAQRITDAFGG